MLFVRGKGVSEIAKRQGRWYRGTQIIDNTQHYEAMAEAAGMFFNLIEAIDPRFKAEGSFGPARRLFLAAGTARNFQVLEARIRQASSVHGLGRSRRTSRPS